MEKVRDMEDYKKKIISLMASDEWTDEEKAKLRKAFPELVESEDERIRKAIIGLVIENIGQGVMNHNNVDCNDMISWLEKQGNPADKVKPKFKVKYAGSEYNVLEVKDIAGVIFYGIEDEPNHIDYVNAENCEIISGYWTDEDERLFNSVYNTLEGIAPLSYEKELDWLKSLKERLQ